MNDAHTDRETPRERSARRLIELLNEVRVALPGVQILFAFLLTLPFTSRFDTVRGIDRNVYAMALIASAVASILFISVAAEHRLRWRKGEKADIVVVSSRAMVWGLAFLAVGMTGAIFVVLRAVLGEVEGTLIAVATLIAFGWFWFALPLLRRPSGEAEPDCGD
jgi:high-affinity Fe2+/Pb2+ permease